MEQQMHSILKNTFLVCVFGLVASGQATAHGNLASATPTINGIVSDPPTELELKFSQAMNVTFSGVKIVGPDKATIGTGKVAFTKGNKSTLIVPILTTLVAGTYSVHWHLLSKDGHRTHGNYTFSVKSQ